MTNPNTTDALRYLTLDEQRAFMRALRKSVKLSCTECGYWNRSDRNCCEACGQEDWKGQ